MSGRNGDRESVRTWIRGALVIVVIAAALGVFGSMSSFERPKLGFVNILGIVVMFAGLALAMASGALAEKLTGARDGRAWLAIRFGGVLVCVAGAMLVFI